MTETERQLLDLLKDRCYREGDFTLSSGAKSTFYFDAKNAFLSSAAIQLIGNAIASRIVDLEIQAIGGLEVGAIPLTAAATGAYYEQYGEPMEGFFVRNEAKAHGTRKIIEGVIKSGWRVAVVDDVATKGGSIMKAVDAVRKAEAIPVVIVALVDRQEGAAELFAKEGIAFRPVFTISQFKS